jgi:hypothetical protein
MTPSFSLTLSASLTFCGLNATSKVARVITALIGWSRTGASMPKPFDRHILVDTLGLLLHAIIHPADVQDRDGGILIRQNPGVC